MRSAFKHKQWVPVLVMLLVLAASPLSAMGELASHSLPKLSPALELDHGDHTHDHGISTDEPETHNHHNPANHTHETADHLTVNLPTATSFSFQQRFFGVDDTPRTVRYRLYRPPKSVLLA
jgi:hypothetical protein